MNEKKPDTEPEDPLPLPKPPAWMTPIPEPSPKEQPPRGAAPGTPRRPPWNAGQKAQMLDLPKPPAWMTPSAEPDAGEQSPIPPEAAAGAGQIVPSADEAGQEPPASPPWMKPIPEPAPEQTASPAAPIAEAFPVLPEEAIPEGIEEAVWVGPDEDEAFDEEEEEELPLTIDPAFVYLILMVVTLLGMNAFAPDVRYAILWSGLTLIAAAAIIVDHIEIERPTLRDVLVGASYGALVGVPLLLIGGAQLYRMSRAMFGQLGESAVFMALAFAMPMAETLFFRGALQAARGPVPAGLAAGLWSVILFMPTLDVVTFPFVAVVIGLAFFLVSLLYSYLRDHLGLFSAWACQVVLSLVALWVPRLLP